MGRTKITGIYIFILALFTALTSCRKDDDVDTRIPATGADTVTISPSAGSFLATAGKLKINIEDTTYVFDAAKDSIAFIKVDTAGNEYFGVTAINKEHSISFGISGSGAAVSKAASKVAGSQFLFRYNARPQVQYMLSDSVREPELSKIVLKKYSNEGNTGSAKGIFTTFLAKDTIQNAALYKITGSFDLEFK